MFEDHERGSDCTAEYPEQGGLVRVPLAQIGRIRLGVANRPADASTARDGGSPTHAGQHTNCGVAREMALVTTKTAFAGSEDELDLVAPIGQVIGQGCRVDAGAAKGVR